MNITKEIFSVYNEYKYSKNTKIKHKIILILGIKLKFKVSTEKIKKQKINNTKLKKHLNISTGDKALQKYYINKNKNVKILVCLHLFYPELWYAISKYLSNLNGYNYDLIITCTEKHYNKNIINKIKIFKPDTQILIYPNIGFDIAPFIDVINKTNLDKYDIVFKIHSKGTARKLIYIYEQLFKQDDWFFNLYNGILGPITTHTTIDHLYNDTKTGIVAAQNLIINDPKHKQFFTTSMAEKYNLHINKQYKYVAGTCFAIKSKCLIPVKNLKLSLDDFETSKRGEFSFAHAMERIICACIETQGYNFYGNNVCYPNYEEECKIYKKNSSLRLLNDERIKLDYVFFYKNLETIPIKDYEIINIKLKDIKRYWNRTILNLKECQPYKYLNGEVQQYQNYCTENQKFEEFMSEERFKKLLDNINKNKFDKKYMPILTEDNIIMDGQHRACILLYKYGEDYEIQCLRLKI